jgi:hypothetical protein
LVSAAPLCNKDIKENLVAALTVKKNACTIKQGKNKYSSIKKLYRLSPAAVQQLLFFDLLKNSYAVIFRRAIKLVSYGLSQS